MVATARIAAVAQIIPSYWPGGANVHPPPHLIHGVLGPCTAVYSKLDGFIRFYGAHRVPNSQTQRQTDHGMCNLGGNRPHLCYACDAA